MRVLNVAEKPSVARALVSELVGAAHTRRNGFNHSCPVFEFPYMLRGQRVQMVVTSVLGHLMSHDFPAEYAWHKCQPDALFTAPIISFVDPKLADVERTLQQEARKCQQLVLWLDCDREGENIAFEVMEVCKKANPRMEVFRARFSALIRRDIEYSLARLEKPNQAYNQAVEARQEIDLRIGAAFTRFQTKLLNAKFGNINNSNNNNGNNDGDGGASSSVVSYGPCQFPTTGFIVERYLENRNFRPDAFWNIAMTLDVPMAAAAAAPATTIRFTWTRQRLFDRAVVVALYENCLLDMHAWVCEVARKPETKRRPLPLATVPYQKVSASKLHIGSKRAMKVAEELYQSGYISYPRTETDLFLPSYDLRALVALQQDHPLWGGYARHLLQNNGFERPRAGGNNDNAHPPIHPTKPGLDLVGDKAKVYEFVVRHFLACCSRDATGDRTDVMVQVVTERFRTRGLVVRERNYLDVYPYDRWEARELPTLHQGQTFVPTSFTVHEGRTEAPRLLTESDLIGLMDKHGIGTDATIAQHIDMVQSRHYARIIDRYFHPTDLGVALVEAYKAMGLGLSTPALRAGMEREMTLISEGRRSKDDFLKDCLAHMKEAFMHAQTHKGTLETHVGGFFPRLGHGQRDKLVASALSACACGRMMDLKTDGARIRYLICPQCRDALPMPSYGELSAHTHHCPMCAGFQVLQVTNTETHKTHTICPRCYANPPPDLEECDTPQLRCFECSYKDCELANKGSSKPVMPCPVCGGGGGGQMQLRNLGSGYFLSCSKYPACGCSYSLPSCVRIYVTDNPCRDCRDTRHLHFRFVPGKVPAFMGMEYEGCVRCDPNLEEFCNMTNRGGGGGGGGGAVGMVRSRRPAPAAAAAAANNNNNNNNNTFAPSRRAAAASSSSAAAAAGAGAAPGATTGRCYVCQKEGHWANNCPSNKNNSNGSAASTRGRRRGGGGGGKGGGGGLGGKARGRGGGGRGRGSTTTKKRTYTRKTTTSKPAPPPPRPQWQLQAVAPSSTSNSAAAFFPAPCPVCGQPGHLPIHCKQQRN